MIWEEERLKEELGPDGYEFFLSKVVPRMSACLFCQGTGTITMPNDLLNDGWAQQGKQTNFTKQVGCWSCYEYIDRLTTFIKMRKKNVPPVYRKMFLRTLQPFEGVSSRVPMERQQTIINGLRANPDAGYAFFGPPNIGKTVMTVALYMEQLWKETVNAPRLDLKAKKYFPVWHISTKTLLDEHTNWTMHRNDPEPEFGLGVLEPTVTVEKIAYIHEHGRVPRLFLEEIDKVKRTEARRANLFEIINAIHDYEGQLVVNSNYSPKEFAQEVGDDLAWRINDMCKKVILFD
jgi:hypothetical protein